MNVGCGLTHKKERFLEITEKSDLEAVYEVKGVSRVKH